MTRISRTEIVYAVGGAIVTRWMVRPVCFQGSR